MHSLDRPVAHSPGSERAPVADSVPEDPPRITGPVAVLSAGTEHLEVVIRALLAEAERPPARPLRGRRSPTRSSQHERILGRKRKRPARQSAGRGIRLVSGTDSGP